MKTLDERLQENVKKATFHVTGWQMFWNSSVTIEEIIKKNPLLFLHNCKLNSHCKACCNCGISLIQ